MHRRTVAVGLLCTTLVLVWVGIADPVIDYLRARADDRQSDLRALSRDHALLLKDAQVSEALVTVSQSPRWTQLYDNQKPDKAVLQLETDLRGLINTPNNPTSMIAGPPVTKGSLTRISVKVILSMPIDQFAGMLGRLHSHAKLLRIENLTVQAPDYQAANSNPTLSIQADITAFMLTRIGAQN
jgi:hypothetical protein